MGNCISKKPAKDEQLEILEEHRATAAAALASSEKQLVQIQEDLANSKKKANAAANEALALQKRLDELEAKHAASEQDGQSYAAKLKLELDNCLEDIKTVKSDAANHLRAVEHAAADELSEVKAQAEKELLSAKASIASSTEHSAKIREQLESTSASLDGANEDLKDLRCQRDRLVSQNETLNGDLEDSRKEVELQAEVISTLKRKKKDLKADLDIITEDLDDMHERHDALRSEYKLSESNVRRDNRMKPKRAAGNGGSLANGFSDPVMFSCSEKDVRIKVSKWKGETRVDIREFYSKQPSQKGISLPAKDAEALLEVLPDVVREAKAQERKQNRR